jgi:hypothetical protein
MQHQGCDSGFSPCMPVGAVFVFCAMIPEPTSAENSADLVSFRDFADDVRHSDQTTFKGNLRQLVKLMRESPLFERLEKRALKPTQFEPWLNEMMSTRDLRWPDDPREKLFLQSRLLCAIVDGQVSAERFAFSVFIIRHVGAALEKFIEQIFHPFAREYLKLAEQLASELLAQSPSTSKPVATPDASMDIFISHSNADEEIAGALAHLFQVGLTLNAKKIRCTSVDGFRLPAGAKIEERLKVEVHNARVLVGLITPASVQSSYVLFELGARWGLGRFMAPLLARGAPPSLLPGPTADINALRADSEEQVHQFLGDIARELGLSAPDPAVYGKYLKEVVRLASIASAPSAKSPTLAAGEDPSDQEKLILRVLWEYDDGLAFTELAKKADMTRADTEYYANELERRGWVHIPTDSDSLIDVSILQDGRRYLKKNGLV